MLRSSCVRFLALLIVAGHFTARGLGQEPDPPRLRVLTYNIHHGRGMDGVFDYERLARIINDLQPDLVALQEVDRGVRRSHQVDQPAVLSELTSLHAAFGNALYYQGGEYGEAILSRFPLDEVRAHHLPFHPGLEPRTALAARVRPGEGLPELLFVGTHLCHQREETRTEQTTRLNTLFAEADLPVILAGDLNARPGSAPMDVLLEEHWVDAIAPQSRIDYILYRRDDPWHVAEVQILDEPVASDHQPVLAVLEWRGPRSERGPDALQPGAIARFGFGVDRTDATLDAGLDGKALRRRPGDGSLPLAIDESVLAADRNFSLQFWVRTIADSDARFVLLSQKQYADNSLASQKNAGWVFYISGGTWAWNMGTGNRRITYERDNGAFMPINDGRWHQLTMTHDSVAGLIRLFFDGRNVVTYNVRDSSGFDFASPTRVRVGWDGPPAVSPSDILPAITDGASNLQELVDAFNGLGLPALQPDELMRVVIDPDRLFESKRRALDHEQHAGLLQALEGVSLEAIDQLTRRLMRNPYTVHQAPSFMEVAPLLKIYGLVDGRITIDRAAAVAYGDRERLDAPSFDIDELTVWNRALAPDEVTRSYAQHYQPSGVEVARRLESLTASAWNIFHGGIHQSIEAHGWDSRQAIIDLIQREEIDVVMMQETYSSGDYIAAELGYYLATTIDWDNLNQGANISVLSRYPIEEVHVPPGSAFMNVAAKIRLSQTQHIYAMSNWYGMRNFPEVFAYHEARFEDANRIPILFAGDFNAVPHTDGGDSQASRRLLEAGFIDAYRSLYPDVENHPGITHRSGSRIDQLYFKGAGLTNTSTTVLSTWPSLFPSDHYLIKAEFEFDDEGDN